ncbi:glycosyltransferase [Candidatus Woesearchaeota archaeon]|nr:MAG: glycosyltransferase [Candidatus Woesearchaeota archaeon]
MQRPTRVCYANPTMLLRRPISELLDLQAGSRGVGLLTPTRKGRLDDSLHHSKLPKQVKLHPYTASQLPGSPFEWPIPGISFVRVAWSVLHEYDVVHIWAHFYLSTLILMLLSIFTRTRIILTMDTVPGYSFSLGPAMDLLFKVYTWTVGRIIYGVPETITLYGEALLPHALRSGIGREKLRVIKTGIKPRKARGKPPGDIVRDKPIVLFAGLLNKRKGVDMVLAVAKRLPTARFLIAGDGPDRERLERRAPANVVFLGWRQDIPELLAVSDAFLFPSRAEGLPGAVMEAMAAGVPVITTAIPCTTDLIVHGVHGLLANPDDVASLTQHLKRVLTDRTLARRLAKNARARMETEFSWARVLPRYTALYDARPVLHVITGLGVGGAEHMLLKTIPHLPGTHIVCSLTDDNALGRKLEEKGVETYYLHLTTWNFLLVLWRLRRLIKSVRPRLINSYLLHANIIARIVGRLTGVKTIICSVRNIHRDRPVWNALDRATSWMVTRYTPNSRAVAAWLTNEVGIPEEKITVIPNCVDATLKERVAKTNRHAKRRELGLQRERVALYVASFKKQKNHETLLAAFSKLPNEWVLLLAGDGPRKKEMEWLARRLRIAKRVRFLGNRADIPELLAVSDVFVFPSRHEGMPNALLEAMAAGVPVVCSDIPENKEVAGEEALYVNADDAQGLANAILKAKKRTRLPERFSRAACIRRLSALYPGREKPSASRARFS